MDRAKGKPPRMIRVRMFWDPRGSQEQPLPPPNYARMLDALGEGQGVYCSMRKVARALRLAARGTGVDTHMHCERHQELEGRPIMWRIIPVEEEPPEPWMG